MSNSRSDITTQADVNRLVDEFYSKVRMDSGIGPIFENRIKDQWEVHLKKMYGFWGSILLGSAEYSGRPFPPHASLGIGEKHFKIWLSLFAQTVDELYEGPTAEMAKTRSEMIAQVFITKLSMTSGIY